MIKTKANDESPTPRKRKTVAARRLERAIRNWANSEEFTEADLAKIHGVAFSRSGGQERGPGPMRGLTVAMRQRIHR